MKRMQTRAEHAFTAASTFFRNSGDRTNVLSTAVEPSEGSNCYTRNFTSAANVGVRQQSIQSGAKQSSDML